MNPLRSMRGRVAALVVAAVALALLAVGAVVVGSFAARERESLDRSLRQRPAPQVVRGLRRLQRRGTTTALPPALRGGSVFARLSRGGRTLVDLGAPDGLGPPGRPGLRTSSARGGDYRVLTRRLATGANVEVGTSLGPARSSTAALRTRVLLLSLLAVVLAGALAWWLAGVALGPLRGLRAGARRVSTTSDLSNRLAEEAGVEEIDALSASVNAMLGRLEASVAGTERALSATREFTADAGHELRTPLTALHANLSALARNPDMGPADRQSLLADAEADGRRALALLESLQILARGEAATAVAFEDVDLVAMVDLALERGARRHPDVEFGLAGGTPGDVTVRAWPDGLTTLLDNLLENAALHGRPEGRVEASVHRGDTAVELIVDDDGPGIPTDQRERVFERFERAARPGAEGSGLGLALVRQQARLHGGEAAIESSPAGGARLAVRLAVSPAAERESG